MMCFIDFESVKHKTIDGVLYHVRRKSLFKHQQVVFESELYKSDLSYTNTDSHETREKKMNHSVCDTHWYAKPT